MQIDGGDAEFRRDGRELVITPADVLPEGQSSIVTVDYQGRPKLLDSLGGVFSGGWTDTGDTIIDFVLVTLK